MSHRKWHFSNLAYFETLGHEITKKMSPTPNPPTIPPQGPQYPLTVETPMAGMIYLKYIELQSLAITLYNLSMWF